METVTDTQELVVWAEKVALAEAKDTFSRFDASFRTIQSASSRKDIPTCKVSLFYLRDGEPNAEFESILKAFKGHKTSFVVLYTPHHSSDLHSAWARLGKHSLDSFAQTSSRISFASWSAFAVRPARTERIVDEIEVTTIDPTRRYETLDSFPLEKSSFLSPDITDFARS